MFSTIKAAGIVADSLIKGGRDILTIGPSGTNLETDFRCPAMLYNDVRIFLFDLESPSHAHQ
jgi:hypothetical protein